jgi:hypothetical protein
MRGLVFAGWRIATVAGCHGGDRVALVGVSGEVGVTDAFREPPRRPARPHVDREVDKAGNEVRVTVVRQVDTQPRAR